MEGWDHLRFAVFSSTVERCAIFVAFWNFDCTHHVAPQAAGPFNHGLPLLGPGTPQDFLVDVSQAGVVNTQGNIGVTYFFKAVRLVVNITVVSTKQLG